MEIWKPISGYQNYEVSTLGRVRSVDFVDSIGRNQKGRILKQSDNGKGYLGITLSRAKPRKYVHRLVADAFCEGYRDGLHVNHRDGNKSNNNFENLEWVSRSENDLHKKRNLEWHRYPVLDLQTGIFYANAKELSECFSESFGVKYCAFKEGIRRNNRQYNRFLR